MDILKLFSSLANLFDSPPTLKKELAEKKENTSNNKNKASQFISAHEKLSKKIKQTNNFGKK